MATNNAKKHAFRSSPNLRRRLFRVHPRYAARSPLRTPLSVPQAAVASAMGTP